MTFPTEKTMTKDEAAAVLGDVHDAYFGAACEACDGNGRIVDDWWHGKPIGERDCPHCKNGRKPMPSDSDIMRAAHVLVEGVDFA